MILSLIDTTGSVCITSHRIASHCIIIPTTFTYIYLRDFIIRFLSSLLAAYESLLHSFLIIELYIYEPDVFTLA